MIKLLIGIFILDNCINVFFNQFPRNIDVTKDSRELLLNQIHYIYNKHYLEMTGYTYTIEEIRKIYSDVSIADIVNDLEELKSAAEDELLEDGLIK